MKKHILIFTAMFLIFTGTLVGCKKENTDSTVVDVETTEELTEVSTEMSTDTSTSESVTTSDETEEIDEVESDTTDSSALEIVEDTKPNSTPESNDKPASTSKPSEETAHTHSWSSATCTSPKTCKCGETSGSKLGHDFGSNNKTCSRCGVSNPNYTASSTTEEAETTCMHYYRYGEINCALCGEPHTHDWKIVVQTNHGDEYIPDEDFVCHSGWYFDTFEELKAHQAILNVHGMVYVEEGSDYVTAVPPGYTGEVAFYASCTGWANCAGDGAGEHIEYEITQEVQFCKKCGVRGEATDIGERVILSHTYDD